MGCSRCAVGYETGFTGRRVMLCADRGGRSRPLRFTASQSATAPKRRRKRQGQSRRFTAGQNAAAPKRQREHGALKGSIRRALQRASATRRALRRSSDICQSRQKNSRI